MRLAAAVLRQFCSVLGRDLDEGGWGGEGQMFVGTLTLMSG